MPNLPNASQNVEGIRAVEKLKDGLCADAEQSCE